MFTILFLPYPEEIIYSWHSRLSRILGSTSLTQTSMEFFGVEHAKPRVHYPIRLDHFVSNIPEGIELSPDKLIEGYTIFPLFKPFLDRERADRAVHNMKGGDSRRLGGEIGINSGGFFERGRDTVKICPICFEEDLKERRSVYLRRQHQVPGNFICGKHEVYLNEYEIPLEVSEYSFYNIEEIEIKDTVPIEGELKPQLLRLSKAIDSILTGALEGYDIERVIAIYKKGLKEKGYLLRTKIDQKKLISDFNKYYSDDFLEKLESNSAENNRKSWIRKIFDKTFTFTHPIRHLLFMLFLFEDIEEFKRTEEQEFKPFGEAPWVCLNLECDFYNENVIAQVHIKSKRVTKEPIGIFKCENCGFAYRRTGIDKTSSDRYRYDSVQEYGHVWEGKFRDLVLNSNLSMTKIAKEMNCSIRKVTREAKKMGIADNLNTKDTVYVSNKIEKDNERLDRYKQEILSFLHENPEASRTEIQNNLSKQYLLAYAEDREWIEENMPKPFENGRTPPTKEDDWEEKDREVNLRVKAAIEDTLKEEVPHRITKTYIAKKIGYPRLLESKVLNRLPETKETILNQRETREEFESRKNNNNKEERK